MEFLEKIKQSGIVGAGGAGFPTHIKLNAKADWFIINAAECEPLIETDKFICRTFANKVVLAAMKISEHLQAKNIVIALKGKYKEEILALKKAIAEEDAPIKICEMGTFYPAGDEQTMVQFVTGNVVPERGLPLDVNTVVDNVGTVLNIYDAIINDKPVYEKYLSVVGEVDKPVMLFVPVGTPIKKCIDAAKVNIKEYAVILGGPMMGKVLSDESLIEKAVVTKTTGNIIVLPKNHYLVKRACQSIQRISIQAKTACIQCRMCTDLCPRYLLGHDIQPHLVMRNLYRKDILNEQKEILKSFGSAANCCSCGICEMFACPMGLSPRKVNDYIKGFLREKGIDVPKNKNPQTREALDIRRIPTERLIARLNLSDYSIQHANDDVISLLPDDVFIPLSQHIGKPATPVCVEGDYITAGSLIAEAAKDGLSANIHASIDGIVKEVDKNHIRITKKEG